ncbi:cold-shock protein [Shewanella litorisediminis]|uniref:Cold shock domain-containing protein n=1 Tax=Shewanella litorisediminis TaxID=1173586 RepID=A0ABX7FYY2_9GAMM|nr:cold shock domain-containing protein [Shewanella litorisediminis]
MSRDNDRDAFVHYRAINTHRRRALKKGQKVSFTLTQGQRGFLADNVSLFRSNHGANRSMAQPSADFS